MANTNKPLEAIKARTAKNKQESETAGLQAGASPEVIQPTETEAEKATREEAEKAEAEKMPAEQAGQKAEAAKEAKAAETEEAFIAPYRKAYPGEKAFHVTSDKQVFLEKDRALAVFHQTSLNNDEKVKTIRVNK